jgi:hypothetical protein
MVESRAEKIALRNLESFEDEELEELLALTINRARNAVELYLSLKFTLDIAAVGINPKYSLRYGIASALQSISDPEMLNAALEAALKLARAGIDPWALLYYSIPAISKCAKSKREFEDYLNEVQQLCFSIKLKRQDLLHQAIASMLNAGEQSKLQAIRILNELLLILLQKKLDVESALQSIISLSRSITSAKQLEIGFQIGLAMAERNRDPTGLLQFGFPRAIEAAAFLDADGLNSIAQMAERLIARGIDPKDVFRYGIRALMKFAKSAEDLNQGLLALEALAVELDRSGINPQATLFYGLRALVATAKSFEQLTRSLQFGATLARRGIDPCNNFKYGIAWAVEGINQSQFEAAIEMAERLIDRGIDPLLALQYGVSIFANTSNVEFNIAMRLLERLMIAFHERNIDPKPLFTLAFPALMKKARSFEEFKLKLEGIEKIIASGNYVNLQNLQLSLEGAIAAYHLEFEEVLKQLMALLAKLEEDSLTAVTYSLPLAIATLRDMEEFEITMQLAHVLIDRNMEFIDHLQYAVPNAARVLKGDEFKTAIQLAIKLAELGIEPYETLYYGIPALAALNESEISLALQLGLKMADLGLDPKLVFTSALPSLAGSREFAQECEAIYGLAVGLNQRKIDPSNAITSLYPTLVRKAVDSKDFKIWSLRISNLNSKLLELCLKNIDVILNYFKQHSDANWNKFILALDLYSKGCWGELVLDEVLMAYLCSPTLSISKCVERARDYFNSQAKQKAFKLGMKIESLKYEDCIGLIALESKLKGKTKALDLILEKIARYGNCYNYFQAEQPIFYRVFKQETAGLVEKFDAPGVKFNLNYKVSAKMMLKSYVDKMPINSDVKIVREVIAELRVKHERLYKRLYKLIRSRGIAIEKALEEEVNEVNEENLAAIIEILLRELQQIEIDGRAKYVLLLLEAYAFKETEGIREKIAAQLDPVLKLNLMAEYWWHNIRTLARESGLIGYKFYERYIAPLLKEKSEVEKNLEVNLGRADTGSLSFALSERGISDLSKGDVSQDCLKDRLFPAGIAHIVDPAFLLFKIFDGGEWMGNVYAVVCKDAIDRNVLLIDNLPIKTEHPILSSRKEDIDIFVKEFIEQIESYAHKMKFDYIVIAQDCSPRVRIKSALEAMLNNKLEKIYLRKAAGNLHFSEFGIETEFIQALGKLEVKQWYEVNGFIVR